jgi:hypothetical protein
MRINAPIHIGRAIVFSGDVVLARRKGIAFIPAHLAERVVISSKSTRMREAALATGFNQRSRRWGIEGVCFGAAFQCILVIHTDGFVLDVGAAFDDFFGVGDLLDGTGGDHVNVAFQEQNPFRQLFHMPHLHDRNPPKHRRQRPFPQKERPARLLCGR